MPNIGLGITFATSGCNVQPHIRSNCVFKDTISTPVHHAEIALRNCIPLLSRLAVPLHRFLMVLTDALLNTGNVDTNTVSEIGRAYNRDGIRLTGVGVGRGFNDTMLDKLTEKGKGAYVFLGSEAVVDRIFGVGFERGFVILECQGYPKTLFRKGTNNNSKHDNFLYEKTNSFYLWNHKYTT